MWTSDSARAGVRLQDPGSRLRRSFVLFGLGLLIQTSIVVLAVPGMTQISEQPPPTIELSCQPHCITVTTEASANVAIEGIWTPKYTFEFASATAFTPTRVVGQLGPGMTASGVGASHGQVEVASNLSAYTVTVDAVSPLLPLVVTPEIRVSTDGIGTQRVGVVFTDTMEVVITSTVVAQPPPLKFDLGYNLPAVLQPGTFTQTWSVAAPNDVITITNVSGDIKGAFYGTVVTDGGSCNTGDNFAAFDCILGRLSPESAPVIISATTRAFQPGLVVQNLRLAAGNESLTYTPTTTVQPPLIPVIQLLAIDIKPGGSPNSINPKSHGKIPVAILSSATFDAPAEIAQMFLTFGPTGEEHSLRFCHPEDADGDGLFDLVCHFDTQTADFQHGDTEGTLMGRTVSGALVRGTDSVRTVPPKKIQKRTRRPE